MEREKGCATYVAERLLALRNSSHWLIMLLESGGIET